MHHKIPELLHFLNVQLFEGPPKCSEIAAVSVMLLHSSNVLCCWVQCFVFGAANAGKTSLLQGLTRKSGQPSTSKGDPEEEAGSPTHQPASNIAVNEISVMRGNRQREGTYPTWD